MKQNAKLQAVRLEDTDPITTLSSREADTEFRSIRGSTDFLLVETTVWAGGRRLAGRAAINHPRRELRQTCRIISQDQAIGMIVEAAC